MVQTTHVPRFTLGALLKQFWGKISFTLLLVILDAAINLLFPLFMGFAINDLLESKFDGLIALAVLGFASLIIGSGRRIYDTRAYAGIYRTVVGALVAKEQQKKSSVSKAAARVSLFTELVEFLENAFPQIVNSLIALVGTLGIIFSLNRTIFIACLISSLFVLIIYGLSERYNFKLNKGYNDALEQQVDVLESADKEKIATHFKNIMRWNIKLSDFETFNFALVWQAMIALLLYAIFAAVNSGLTAYGTIFSLVIYVFEYIGSIVALPLYFQQLIRLNEISMRLND